MVKLSAILLYFILIWVPAYSQREVTTLSGQKIILFNDGRWQEMVKHEIETDSAGLLVNELDPMTTPVTDTMDGTFSQAWTQILSGAKIKEIKEFVVFDSLDREMAIMQIAYEKAKKSKDKDGINQSKKQIGELKSLIESAQNNYRASADNIAKIQKIPSLPTKEQNEKLHVFGDLYGISVSSLTNTPPTPLAKEIEVNKLVANNGCQIIRDEKIKKIRYIETNSKFLFNYTPDKLKRYFKEKELMQVSAGISKVAKQFYLNFTIKIISKDASKNYGIIQKDNMLKINLISGRNIVLNAFENSVSELESYTGHAMYHVKYPISEDDLNSLSKTPLDSIGLMWSSGFELYEIYEVDALMTQISCIKSL